MKFLNLFFSVGILSLFYEVLAMSEPQPQPQSLQADFYDYITKYGLLFKSGEEYVKRFNIYVDNMYFIEKHNKESMSANTTTTTTTFSLKPNKFSHLTFDEFKTEVGMTGKSLYTMHETYNNTTLGATATATNVPKEIDWVEKGAVTPVKNQGKCGSCWSFSTTGALEGAFFLKWGTLESFSEQELVSCDKYDKGCNGGLMDDAFKWVEKNGGLSLETDYPYVSGTDGTVPKCDKTIVGVDDNKKVAPTTFVDVKAGDMNGLMAAVAQQPVSIAIEADQPAFQFYSGGVLTGKCGQKLDHGVLLVGYGTLNGIDYWKVKNSWGADWGLDGYILIERSDKNLCGVLDSASYPVL